MLEYYVIVNKQGNLEILTHGVNELSDTLAKYHILSDSFDKKEDAEAELIWILQHGSEVL